MCALCRRGTLIIGFAPSSLLFSFLLHFEPYAIGNQKRHANTEKHSIAQRALLPGSSIASVACAESLPESTVQGWQKNIKKVEESVVGINCGKWKAMHNDKTPTLTKGLWAFCERARRLIPPLPVMVESISVKELSAWLLHEHEKYTTIIKADEADMLRKMVFIVQHGHLVG